MSSSEDITGVGPWSEIKLRIIKEYASAYSRILAAQQRPRLTHVYIDAFAGAGVHESRETGELLDGSPTVALKTDPPFREYHFVDLQQRRVDYLREHTLGGAASEVAPANVYFYNEDCNAVLLESVFPRVRYQDYRRGLCLLDPYGLHFDWQVVKQAGNLGTMELFLNFPIYDMNLNVLRRDPDNVHPSQVERMNRFWGDESWRDAAYSRTGNLFGWEEKQSNEDVARAYRIRLKREAGFKHVPEPIPMRNSKNAVVYYLFFAAQRPAASHIVEDIFNKYRR